MIPAFDTSVPGTDVSFAPVQNPLRLAYRPLQRPRLFQAHPRPHVERRLEARLHLASEALHVARVIREDLIGHLHPDFERVQLALPVNHHEVVRLYTLYLEQRPLDLRRIDVDAPDYQHVVSAPEPVSYTHLRAHETRHDLVCR